MEENNSEESKNVYMTSPSSPAQEKEGFVSTCIDRDKKGVKDSFPSALGNLSELCHVKGSGP